MIEKDEIEVEVYRDDSPSVDVAVRLTHKPSGITAESWDRERQKANYAAAMSELERRLAGAAGPPSFRRSLRRWLGRLRS